MGCPIETLFPSYHLFFFIARSDFKTHGNKVFVKIILTMSHTSSPRILSIIPMIIQLKTPFEILNIQSILDVHMLRV